ncbi:MAG: DUF1553 domain-containing protein [Acidobacteriaceae bacterium]|nr:DUF1553 domain-containing protein [Acidobacteriaceae bacterium]
MRLVLALGLASLAYADATAILARRCLSCHNDSTRLGNLSLQSRTTAAAVLPAKLLARVERGEMPPGGGLPPEERTVIQQWIAAGAPWDQPLSLRPRATSSFWSLQPLANPGGSIDSHLLAALREKGLAFSPPADRRTLIRRATFDLTGLPPTPAEIEAFLQDPAPNAYETLIDRLLASPAYGERWGRHWLDVIRYGESHGYEQNHIRPHAWRFRDYVIRAFNQDLPFNRFMMEQVAGDLLAPGDPNVEVATGFLVAGPHDTVGNSNLAAKRQQRADDLDDIVNATASSFLGLTVNCARCHNHKFDPIQQLDYYRLAAIFNGVTHADRPVATPAASAAHAALIAPLDQQAQTARETLARLTESTKSQRAPAEAALRARHRSPVSPFGAEESWPVARARYVRFSAPQGFPGGLDELELFTPDGQNLAPGATLSVSSTRVAEGNPDAYHPRHLNDAAFDKRWFPNGAGAASITLALPAPALLQKLAWSTDRLRAFQGRFQQNTVSQYQIELSLDGQAWTPVASHHNRLPHRQPDLDRLITLEALNPAGRAAFEAAEAQLEAAETQRKQIAPLPLAYAGLFQKPAEPVYLLKGGSVMQRGDPVAPASLSTLSHANFTLPLNAPEGEARLQFARWLADNRNPLTPRVIANRLWHYHFGRGLVATPSDFGYNGERPSHPALLDYLAQRLLAHNWRLKPLHKEILLSAAYQQSSAFQPAAARLDADSRLLWRFPPQRLQAESLRDAMLHVAGVLNPERGGPSFRLYKYTVDNVATYFPLDQFGPETYRRSVYAESARSISTELLTVFDCPDSSLPEPRRVSTTSPLQALSLLNHSFTIDMARALERRLAAHPPGEQIRQAFLLAYGRPPEPAELDQSRQLLARHGFLSFARALFNTNEFLYVF